MARRVRAPRGNTDPDPAKRVYGNPVYTWAFASSQPRGGTIVTYETRLEEDGVLRCNCMGWVFVRKDKNTGLPKPRECKHTNMVLSEAPTVLRRWRSGEELPVLNTPEVTARAIRHATQSIEDPNPTSRIRYGRLIEV